jgi:hypothetical protein
LSYAVLHSPDGNAWDILAIGITETHFIWNTTMSPGGTAARVRVVAMDGWHTAQDDSDDLFTLPTKGPTAAIGAPSAGAEFVHGRPVALQGMAYDPEDGPLTGAALAWSSDVSGNLGSGALIHLSSLAVGHHVISLQARDRDGHTATVTTTLTILADTDGDGMPDNWEARYAGLDPRAPDGYADLDHDWLMNVDEHFFGTDPTKPDTDGDGHPDGIEIQLGSDPLDPQSTPTYLRRYLPLMLRRTS